MTYNSANAIIAGTAALVQTHLVMLGQSGGPEKGESWSWSSTFTSSDMIMDSCIDNQDKPTNWWCRILSLWEWTCTVTSDVLDRELHDSRLYPAAYLQGISVLAIFSLSVGIYRCHIRKQGISMRALQTQAEQVIVTHYPTGLPANFPTIEYVQV